MSTFNLKPLMLQSSTGASSDLINLNEQYTTRNLYPSCWPLKLASREEQNTGKDFSKLIINRNIIGSAFCSISFWV